MATNLKLAKAMEDMKAAIDAATGKKGAAPAPAAKPAKAEPPAKAGTLTKQFEERAKAASVPAAKVPMHGNDKPKPNFSRAPKDDLGNPTMKGGEEDHPIHVAVLHGLALKHHKPLAQVGVLPFAGQDNIYVRCVAYGNGYLIGVVDNKTGQTFGHAEYHATDKSKTDAWTEWENMATYDPNIETNE